MATMKDEAVLPVLFAGHGSPMNAIENNPWSETWERIGMSIPRPDVIIAVSAHWCTDGQKVRTAPDNPQIYDMYGFPPELYELKYAPAGHPAFAEKIEHLTGAEADNSHGIDHGVWSVLCRMFPNADIPVVMMSTDVTASPEKLYETGKRMRELRKDGALIVASGNVVHNLALCDYRKECGYGWTDKFDSLVKDIMLSKDRMRITEYEELPYAERAAESDEHFRPLVYAAGASDENDYVEVWNDDRTLGALSMTSYTFRR